MSHPQEEHEFYSILFEDTSPGNLNFNLSMILVIYPGILLTLSMIKILLPAIEILYATILALYLMVFIGAVTVLSLDHSLESCAVLSTLTTLDLMQLLIILLVGECAHAVMQLILTPLVLFSWNSKG